MKKLEFAAKHLNLWIVLVLVIANLYAWNSALASLVAPHVVEAKRDQEIVQLLDYIY